MNESIAPAPLSARLVRKLSCDACGHVEYEDYDPNIKLIVKHCPSCSHGGSWQKVERPNVDPAKPWRVVE